MEAVTDELNNRFRKHLEALDRQRTLRELRVVVAGDHDDAQVLGASVGNRLLKLGVVLLGLVEQIAGNDQPLNVQLAALLEDVFERGESLRMILLSREMVVGCNGYAQEDP